MARLSALVHAAYWRLRRLFRRPAVRIGLTNEDDTPGDVLDVYSGHIERLPREVH